VQGIRHEDRHHTDEQISDAVRFAASLVDELGVPSDLREPAFVAAVNLRTAKQITVEAVVGDVPSMIVPRGL
jgi:hypothetical protein